MATTVFDPKEWFASVIPEDTELSEEMIQARDLLLADPAITQNIGNSVLRQSDYSRQSDKLKADRATLTTSQEEAEALKQEGADFILRNKDRDHNNVTLHDQLVADLEEANRRITAGDGETVTRRVEKPEVTTEVKPEVEFMTLKEYQEAEAARDANTIAYSTTVVQLSNKFRNDFGKDFDPAPVVEFATKNNLNLTQAYDGLYSEEYAAKSEADVQARIDSALKEQEIELRSAHDFPELEAGPSRVSGLDQPAEQKLETEDKRVAAAVAGLAQVRSGDKTLTDKWND